MLDINRIYLGDCVDVMKQIDDDSVDLTVTSPPYDNMRTYNGYSFDFESVAQELYRVTKIGGVVVWVVGDATVKGSETGTSFKQALYFKEIGFNLHDTMIWNKGKFSAVGTLKTRYASVFEYMFIFTKEKLSTFHPIKDRINKTAGQTVSGKVRQANGTMKPKSTIGSITAELGQRFNIWEQCPQQGNNAHPAPFPLKLAQDHISSWSNEGDLILDPFGGSGTTGIAAINLNRNYIMIEMSSEYIIAMADRLYNHTK